jgi:hypothetical protein
MRNDLTLYPRLHYAVNVTYHSIEKPKAIRGMSMGIYEYQYLAQAYGGGAYGNCTYNTSTTCSTTGTTAGGGTGSGSLTNTGFMVAAIVTVACIIILAAILVRWWRRPHSKAKQPVPPQTDVPSSQDDKKL